MGTKQSKIEGEYLPDTPPKSDNLIITVKTEDLGGIESNPDPRSPHVCRTPLNEVVSKKDNEMQIYQQDTPIAPVMSSSGLLKKRFLKGFSYNLNDPRSPSELINRTPIVFEELDSQGEKSLSLDDTFSDLFVTNESVGKSEKEDILDSPLDLSKKDPRSPSIGVDRTPIILTDDTPDEGDMIEAVLETLRLTKDKKPENKPLERIKNPKERAMRANRNTKMIYKDEESYTTPKANKEKDPVMQTKRTPLSCVGNKSHLRSKSAENTINSKPSFTSYDDSNLKVIKNSKCDFRGENNENSNEIF